MAVGKVMSAACGQWQRGLDCGFSEDRFHAVAMAIWLLTALAFLGKALLPVRAGEKAPSGASRRCLLLAAASSACCSLDALCVLAFSKPETAEQEYGYGTLNMLGSILLVFALRLFAHLWADVAGALGSLEASKAASGSEEAAKASGGGWSASWALRVVRRGYDCIAVLHIPFALAMAASVYSWGPEYDDVMWAWIVWCFLSACCASSFLAFLMWHVVRCLGDAPKAPSLRCVTFVNLCEQVLYDGLLFLCGLLYSTSAYNQYGAVQGMVFALTFLLLWLMHVQVLVFFSVCNPSDPLYSCQEFQALVAESTASQQWPAGDAENTTAAPKGAEGGKAMGTLLGAAPAAAVLGAAAEKPELVV